MPERSILLTLLDVVKHVSTRGRQGAPPMFPLLEKARCTPTNQRPLGHVQFGRNLWLR
jgi:hypothetical protein